jgi:catechol 2,3-dioxygenase-like lactoylglutathione lyase family enzyme
VIKSIDHVAVVTADVERAAEFYTELLGFQETARLETTHSGTIIFVSLNGCQVELFGGGKPRDPGEEVNEVGYKHITLLVDDVDAEYARLNGRGVDFYMEPTAVESGLRLAFFRDPDGNAIELLQRPE